MESPIILTAEMGDADQVWADRLRAQHFPPERNFLAAHITLFHHLPPNHLPEIKALVARLACEYPSPPAHLSEVLMLGRGVAYRVTSPMLDELRAKMAEAFHGLLTPQDQAKPRFHITIQNKVEPTIAKALHRKLAADFQPRPLSITAIGAHYYRGGPWDQIARWAFRGK